MSKDGALALLSGQPVPQGTTTPSLITQGMPAPEVVTPEKVQLESDRFAKLAAREAAFVKERETIKAEKLEFEKQKESLRKVQTDIAEFEELKKTDKIAALKKIGFSEEDIFNFMAGKEEPKEKTSLEIAQEAAAAETQKLRDEMRTAAEALQAEKTDKAINAYKAEIGNQIKKESEKFEFCAHNGAIAEELIYETILGFMNDDNALSPVDAMKEAIEAVEKMYEEEYNKLKALKKLQPKVVDVPAEQAKPTPKPMLQAKPTPTLTNKATATVSSTVQTSKETKAQKRERLENALRNMGKN